MILIICIFFAEARSEYICQKELYYLLLEPKLGFLKKKL